MESFKQQFTTNPNKTFSADQTSIIVAMLSVGCALGALLAAPVGDHFGRRLSLIGSVLFFSGGVVFQVAADNIPILLVGRCVEGYL
jgi:MFS family permease